MQRVRVATLIIVTAFIGEAAGEKVYPDGRCFSRRHSFHGFGRRCEGYLGELSRMHRVQATAGYHRAAEYIHDRALPGLAAQLTIELEKLVDARRPREFLLRDPAAFMAPFREHGALRDGRDERAREGVHVVG